MIESKIFDQTALFVEEEFNEYGEALRSEELGVMSGKEWLITL